MFNFSKCMIHFHEPKYKIDPEIYEFYNSISSLFYVIVALVVNLITEDNELFFSLTQIGVFSLFFHGSGSLPHEILDEVSILFFMARIDEILSGKKTDRIDIFLVYIIFISFFKFSGFYVLLTFVSLDVFFQIIKKFSENLYSPFDRRLFCETFAFFSLSKCFWLAEHNFHVWWAHSVWHILSAISLGMLCILVKRL